VRSSSSVKTIRIGAGIRKIIPLQKTNLFYLTFYCSRLLNGVGFGSSEYIVFRSKGTIESEYLFYFLSQDSFRNSGAHVMTGAVGHKRVPKDFIENHPILLPPLPEQRQIVAILDEAFEGIDRAIANTEKNLANSANCLKAI
jgi:type I restriction enzyme S subunit